MENAVLYDRKSATVQPVAAALIRAALKMVDKVGEKHEDVGAAAEESLPEVE